MVKSKIAEIIHAAVDQNIGNIFADFDEPVDSRTSWRGQASLTTPLFDIDIEITAGTLGEGRSISYNHQEEDVYFDLDFDHAEIVLSDELRRLAPEDMTEEDLRQEIIEAVFAWKKRICKRCVELADAEAQEEV